MPNWFHGITDQPVAVDEPSTPSNLRVRTWRRLQKLGAVPVKQAAVVHDLDLKDGRFGAQEAPTVGTVIEGLQLSVSEDDALLTQGKALFESLYRAFELSARSSRPRPVARSRRRASARQRKAVTRRRSTG